MYSIKSILHIQLSLYNAMPNLNFRPEYSSMDGLFLGGLIHSFTYNRIKKCAEVQKFRCWKRSYAMTRRAEIDRRRLN